MTSRGYRRLTRFLAIFLFVVFFLLYLLLAGKGSDQRASNTPESGWGGDRHLALGTIALSNIHSGGFNITQLPVVASVGLDSEDFEEQVLICDAKLYNEGSVPISVKMDVFGTVLENGKSANPGLVCGFYADGGEGDPLVDGYRGYFTAAQPAQAQHLTLYQQARYPTVFTLPPGGAVTYTFMMWVDKAVVPLVTDSMRENYSITVKLIARAA